MAYVYEIINDINNKSYIGKTEFSIERRFREHYKEAFRKHCEQRPLYTAIRKYGIDHFHIKLLEETNEPELREMYWIAKKHTYEYGYNATRGGDGKKYINYEEVLRLYSELKNQKLVADYLGITAHAVLNILHKYNIKTANPLVQRKAVEQLNIHGSQVQCFDSCSNAARYLIEKGYSNAKLNTVTSKITECANSKRKTAYGFTWRFL